MADTRILLTLAHPLSAEQAARVGAVPRHYRAAEQIIVPSRAAAMTIINAGYAAVNPTKPDQVRAALAVHPADPAAAAAASAAAAAPPVANVPKQAPPPSGS